MATTLLPQSEGKVLSFQPRKSPQVLATLTGTIGCFVFGTALAWTSPTLKDIEERGDLDGLKQGSEGASWIGAMIPIGALAAGLAGGWMVDTLGRKRTMVFLSLPLFLGWLIIGFAKSLAVVLIGRFLTGFAGGAFLVVVPMYVGEIAQSEIRGLLCNSVVLVLCIGILFTYIVGTFVSWFALAFICTVPPVILAATAARFIPESPVFLLKMKRRDEALAALKWLRGAQHGYQVESELKEMETILAERTTKAAGGASFRDLLARPVLRPTLISLALMWLQQFSGINAVIFYSVSIFESAGTGMDDNLSAILLGLVQVVAVFVSTVLVDRLGRKILLIVSELGMALSLLALGAYFYIKDGEKRSTVELGWLPLTSLIVYMITYNLAMGPLPWTLTAEILPPHAKCLGSSIASAACWILAFVIAKFFGNMLTALTSYGCYWFFAGWCFLGFIFALLVVPETKGKTLEEIQRYFTDEAA